MPGNNRLFISHTHGDNERCLPLLAALDAWDVDYWFDVQQLDAGQQLSERLQQAIAERDIFVCVLTPATPQSFWMAQELSAFRGLQAEDAKHGRGGWRRVIQLALTPDAPREAVPAGDLALDATNQPQAVWLRQLRDAVGVSARPRPLSRRAVISIGAAAGAGIVAVSAGGTWLLAGNHGASASAATVPRTTAPTPTTQATASRVKWTFHAGGEESTAVAVGGGAAYLLADDGLYALGAADGAVKWHLTTVQAGSRGGLLLDGDTLYVSSDSIGSFGSGSGVVAYAVADGTQRWLSPLDAAPTAAPTLANGTIYAAAGGTVVAIATADGTRRWATHYAKQGTRSAPVIAGGRLYIGAEDGVLHVLDAAGGYPLWQFAAGGQIGGSAAVGGGAVCFTAEDGYFYAVDLATLAPRWAPVRISYLEDSTPLVRDGIAYVGSGKGFLNAIDVATGKLRWQSPAGEASDDKTYVKNGAAIATAPTIDGSTIYTVASSTSATSLYAFNLADGSALWHYDVADGGDLGHETSPMVSAGQLYFCGNGQTLFTLGV
jgi:outer membrane protein assembly factor BamB